MSSLARIVRYKKLKQLYVAPLSNWLQDFYILVMGRKSYTIHSHKSCTRSIPTTLVGMVIPTKLQGTVYFDISCSKQGDFCVTILYRHGHGASCVTVLYRHGASCMTVLCPHGDSCMTVLYRHIITTQQETLFQGKLVFIPNPTFKDSDFGHF